MGRTTGMEGEGRGGGVPSPLPRVWRLPYPFPIYACDASYESYYTADTIRFYKRLFDWLSMVAPISVFSGWVAGRNSGVYRKKKSRFFDMLLAKIMKGRKSMITETVEI